MLGRILIVIGLGLVILCEAAIIAVMKDNARGDHQKFHRWLITWAAVNTTVLVVGSWIITGSVFGLGS